MKRNYIKPMDHGVTVGEYLNATSLRPLLGASASSLGMRAKMLSRRLGLQTGSIRNPKGNRVLLFTTTAIAHAIEATGLPHERPTLEAIKAANSNPAVLSLPLKKSAVLTLKTPPTLRRGAASEGSSQSGAEYRPIH